MRLFKRHTAAAAVAAILGFGGGVAEAAPIPWDETFNPSDVLFNNTTTTCTGNVALDTTSAATCRSLQFVFALDGFNAATDTLLSGSVTFTFYDDNTPGPDNGGSLTESVSITLDGVLAANELTITNGATAGVPFTTSAFDVLAALNDGQLTVLLALAPVTGNNDFFFASARLIARGERDADPPNGSIPEPASLLLFGLGATALAARRRLR